MTTTFQRFAETLVAKYDDRLFNYGPDEQTAMAVRAMNRLHGIAPLSPVINTDVDLAGFGKAPLLYASQHAEYLLLSDIAEQLGWFMPRAHKFAQLQHGFAIEDQRRNDEERGDGRLGWECMRDFIRLDVDLIADDPEAKPDANGKRWSDYSDWLVSKDRLPLILSHSPWGKEFMNNTMDAFSHGMRKIWGDKLKDIPTVTVDGHATGSTVFDMFATGLTEEEALRKARRGPALDADGGQP